MLVSYIWVVTYCWPFGLMTPPSLNETKEKEELRPRKQTNATNSGMINSQATIKLTVGKTPSKCLYVLI